MTTGELSGELHNIGIRTGVLWGGADYRRLPLLTLLAYEEHHKLVYTTATIMPHQRDLIEAHFTARKRQQGE